MHTETTRWPPEFDIVEQGDRETHEHAPVPVDTGRNLTTEHNTYRCAWFRDRVERYVKGERIRDRPVPPAMTETVTDPDPRPFGLIFSTHVNRIGEANLDAGWTEPLRIDRTRWERTYSRPLTTGKSRRLDATCE